MMPVPDPPHEQMEDAAFWVVEGEYGLERWPIDDRAIYGLLATWEYDEFPVPHRKAPRDLVTAIREVRPEDRVRVNRNGWMNVVEKDDEGFVAYYENGHVNYTIQPRNPRDQPRGTFDCPWMRRYDTGSSQGEVLTIEVDWAERPLR